MKCPFCAEDIRDEAILCRFCGARRVDGNWTPPSDIAPAPKSNFTMVSSGWLLIVSAVIGMFSLTSPVMFFGSMRGGALALLYNVAFNASFAAMGIALVLRKPWVLVATAVASAIYTFDKLEFVLDTTARKAAFEAAGAGALSALGFSTSQVEGMASLIFLTFLLCWWLFVTYIYFKRDYFVVGAATKTPDHPGAR